MAASAISSENTVKKIYQTVIDEVLMNVREAFLDEGYDEQLLQELKQMWESKLNTSRAVQTGEEAGPHRLPINQDRSHLSKEPHSTNSSASAQSSSSASNSTDLKPGLHMLDPTRAALQALPHSMYKNSNQELKNQHLGAQLDGGVDGSSSEDDEDDDIIGGESNHGDEDDEDDDDKTNNDDQSEHGREDPDPLNSEDDLSPGSKNSDSDLFDTEHVIVCQYDKITRIKNKWKFHLKDGIMNINGKDYLFSKANGDAEW